jgi:hypothetical protein
MHNVMDHMSAVVEPAHHCDQVPNLVEASDDEDESSHAIPRYAFSSCAAGCRCKGWPLPPQPPSPPPMTAEECDEDLLDSSSEAWLSSLEEEKRLVEALPFVKGEVVFAVSDAKTNENKVSATVTCCWAGGRFKRVFVHCDQEPGGKTTHLEALRALRQKLIDEHGGTDHPVHPKAAERRAALAREGSSAQQEESAFDRMKLATARQQAAQRQAAIDEAAATAACETLRTATAAYESAQARATASRAAAELLQPPSTSHKRQKTAFASTSASAASAATTPGLQFTSEPPPEPEWKQWSPDRWLKHETEVQNRRAVPLEPFIGPLPRGVQRGSKPESEARLVVDGVSTWAPGVHGTASLPRGDETRGWRYHWRRGVFGNLCDWASGNRRNIAIMLAESALHFGVVDEVSSASMLCNVSHLLLCSAPLRLHCMLSLAAGCRATQSEALC